METLDLGPATATLTRLVRGVRDDQLGDPTPCTTYTVADLVDHVGGLAVAFVGAALKQPAPGSEQGGTGDGSRLVDGWRDRIAADLARLAEVWRDPAAYDGSTMAGPVEMSGAEAAVVALDEVVVHGWDLARATGQPFEAEALDVEVSLGFARSFSGPESAEMRGDAFGPVVLLPDDAPPLHRLLGLLGRDPRT